MPSAPFRKPRHSLEAFDKLFERAFAPRESLAPISTSDDIHRLTTPSPPSPSTPFYSPVDPNFPIPISPLQEVSLDPIWEEVRQTKERELEGSPSKVKSLEGAMSQRSSSQTQTQTQTQVQTNHGGQGKKRVTKRRSSVNFRESPDGRNMLVTFDMTGVKKQDMHVSYRTNRLIVSWRVERTVEKQDGDVVMREREVRRYSHTIPLPEGTKFEEVRASRDGQRLTLTLPNSKCVRADTEQVQLESLRTIPDIDAALSGISEYHSC